MLSRTIGKIHVVNYDHGACIRLVTLSSVENLKRPSQALGY